MPFWPLTYSFEKLLQAIREARKEAEMGGLAGDTGAGGEDAGLERGQAVPAGGLARDSDWKLAIEFRDRSWYIPAIYQLLEDHDATVVLHDMPKSATPPGRPRRQRRRSAARRSWGKKIGKTSVISKMRILFS